ncbi:MAG: sigma-70 family RNA polymerase sigma factor [Deltaproteobacteria bacterium]|nr:sigma-70 family RNA polymerase sigma factor [Deltaproteobacteria bacterium]
MSLLEQAAPQRGRELDQITLARARRGDRSAQADLVTHYGPQIYALVGRLMVSQPSQVDDLAQDTLIKVLGALPHFDPQGPARLSTWILTVATRTCLDVLRRRRRVEPLVDEPEGTSASPERTATDRQLARKVMRAMAELPDEQRAVLVLRAYHDWDYDEIGTALKLEPGTVKSRLSRARQALRQALGGPEDAL